MHQILRPEKDETEDKTNLCALETKKSKMSCWTKDLLHNLYSFTREILSLVLFLLRDLLKSIAEFGIWLFLGNITNEFEQLIWPTMQMMATVGGGVLR